MPQRALWAAAAGETLLTAVLAGCAQAGLEVEALGPAADVLPRALLTRPPVAEIPFTNGSTWELLSVGPDGPWRSRLVMSGQEPAIEWVTPLEDLGGEAPHYAAAYAGALARPRLELFPPETRAARASAGRRRFVRVAALGAALWVLSAAMYVGRLSVALHLSRQYIAHTQSTLDSALALRRELDAGRATLEAIAAAEGARSRQVGLLADLTAAIGDSAFLVALVLGPDGTIRLAGFAPSTARVLADLERVQELRGGDAKLEGPVTREAVGGRDRDRFAIVAHVERGP